MAEASEAAVREAVLAQLARTVVARLHRGDLINLPLDTITRLAHVAAEAALGQAVLLPPGWSLEWLQDPQARLDEAATRIPVTQAQPGVGYAVDREALGRLVRDEWLAWAEEQPEPKASWLQTWDELSEAEREVDRRIGERLYREARAGFGRAAGLIRYHLQNADIGAADRAELAAVADALDASGEVHRSYHDLHITTDTIPRTSIFDLPYGIEVSCTRVSGWQIWDMNQMQERVSGRLLAGEYDAEPEENEEGRPIRGGLRLDVAGFVIVDSLTPKPEPGPTYRLGDVADIRFAGGERRAVFMPKYVPAGHPRQDAWVWPEGHVVASQVRDVRLVDRD